MFTIYVVDDLVAAANNLFYSKVNAIKGSTIIECYKINYYFNSILKGSDINYFRMVENLKFHHIFFIGYIEEKH